MGLPQGTAGLPIVEALDALGHALAQGDSAVVVAPPGAGKTTVVPLWLIDQPWTAGGSIVVLEPRRIATRAAAHRMATLLGEDVGRTVGYQTRDERRIGQATRIEVVTEGVLTRRVQSDPSLAGVAAVVFDEVHERNLPTDLGLALTLDARSELRPDLRVLAMSATPDSARIAELLGRHRGEPAPVVTAEGRTFPVDLRWRPTTKDARIEHAVADAILTALRDEPGDMLVFLPGIGEIRRTGQALASRLPPGVDLHELAGMLPFADQDAALQPSPPGRRRVVLSTDIAESSLTVSGVRIVIDAGRARVPRFDRRTGLSRLTTVAASRASADQRAGRAGRTEPGVAYRLWSKIEHGTRLRHLPAEITEVDLAGLALELAAWPGDVGGLAWLDPPPAKALASARELLHSLGAITGDGRLTADGRAMLALPVHPRLARMVVGAGAGDGSLAAVLAALVDERDVLRGRADEVPADLALRVRVVSGRDHHDQADRRAVEQVRDRARDIARRAGIAFDPDDADDRRAGQLLALAYPDRIAVRRSKPGQFQLRGGSAAWVPDTDPLATAAFVVAADLHGNRSGARIRSGAGLEADELVAALGDAIEQRVETVWDKVRDDLVVRTEHRFGAVVLRESVAPAEPGRETVAALVRRVAATRLAALPWTDEARNLRARIALLRRVQPDGGWPDWSDGALVRTIDDWLAPYLLDARGADDLRRLDVAMLLTSQLDWDHQVRLADDAPATLRRAAGGMATIDYTRERPTARVRVQDLFGTADHPHVAGLPLTLELLSPADRPIQTTADLPGFWAGSWAEVRKEMAGRYPKHHWPLDAANAPPPRLKRPPP